MNVLLSKHRPKDLSKEEWVKNWNGIGYSLSALYYTIKELQLSSSRVKEDDFSIPNHYALLAYEAGKKAAYQEIIDMLPDNSKI
jgi:hypothetical protein